MAEIELLTTHGILHLLGYDHAEPEEHAEMFGLQDEILGEWRAADAAGSAPTMGEVGLPLAAALLVLLAGVFSAADAALASFSHARAEELLAEGRPGARRLVSLLEDSAALPEHRAAAAAAVRDRRDRAGHPLAARPVRRRLVADRAHRRSR